MRLLNYYKHMFIASIVLTVISIGCLLAFGLKLGIDFKGGTVTEIVFNEPGFDQDEIKGILAGQNINNAQLQPTDGNGLIIRTETLEKEQHDKLINEIRSGVGDFQEKRFESIGPVVGEELKRNALYQLGLVSAGIIMYIAYAFRKIARPITPFQFGISAVMALLHDLIIVLGVFALLGRYQNVEIDSLFVTAMLTVLGFSVHDTIIVFDRIRENLKVYAGQSLEFIINHSISQTLVRSLNTSLTVLFVLLALLLFGGETIRYFVLALFIGIAVGTYSSIFVASPLLLLMQKWHNRGKA